MENLSDIFTNIGIKEIVGIAVIGFSGLSVREIYREIKETANSVRNIDKNVAVFMVEHKSTVEKVANHEERIKKLETESNEALKTLAVVQSGCKFNH